MLWNYIISFVSNLVSGILIALMVTFLIDKKIEKHEQNKCKMAQYYFYLLSLQNKKISELSDLSSKLGKMELFFNNKSYLKNGIYNKFNNVYRDIKNVLRLNNNDQIIISKNNADLQELLSALQACL